MKKALLDIVLFCLKLLRIPRNVIILESVPDFSGSPKCIADELKRRFGDKYRFFWAVEKEKKYLGNRQVLFFWGEVSLWDKIRKYYYLLRAKIIIDSNRPVLKLSDKCLRLFTRHGGTLKKNDKYMKSLGKMDYVLSLSPYLAEIDFQILNGCSITRPDQVLNLGYPANDMVFSDFDIYKCEMFKGKTYHKIVVWLPTFRNHKNNDESISLNLTGAYSMPIVHRLEDFEVLNSALKKLDVFLIVQLHPAQIAVMPKEEYSHICFLTQEQKEKNGIITPNLLHCADALITDYSAAYYEYVLLNRPIGLSIDDFEDYAAKIGFCVDYDSVICGDHLKNMDDLVCFLTNVAKGEDFYSEQRMRALKKIHQYVDNQSTKRVVDFISTQLDL